MSVYFGRSIFVFVFVFIFLNVQKKYLQPTTALPFDGQNRSPKGALSAFPAAPSPPVDFSGQGAKVETTHNFPSTLANGEMKSITVQNGGKEEIKTLIRKEYVAEFIGTLLLVVFGCGSNCTATYNGAFSGVWQIASAWGMGVAIAVYCTASVSGAHINPAVSFATALQGRATGFSWKDFRGYVTAQMLGAFTGALANFAVFSSFIKQFEMDQGITRGEPESFKSALAFGEYPNSLLSPAKAFLVEVWATSLLMFSIKGITDPKSSALVNKDLAPLLIGFVVCILICLFGPLTQCCMNPARDFGPRLVTFFTGWGSAAIPGPRNCFWIYLLGPLIGAAFGAYMYDTLIAPKNDDASSSF
mmetsp:Transcript_13454/g.17719  ORF Transcript_13454/g.17719 Transcript_13454/m.17719 type:complete len:359 (+) Transcript_13454:74-1150(+)|eukprot:CAMPEP_0117769574 /NCGR_PEP_ID=MMETSP0947-20121206/23131_1 /TAXON_ID=44440 /ORGANISM="Chattonella subsalsa, Strain CCMP2191" /LENGTH=358 /DNA_ID=CAMNT_0005594131 /DNA_START=64 /DNA_END=1140 /DNA_ORIENTATION=-